MSRGSVKNSINDGALGAQGADATGIFCAVGVATNPSAGIQIFTDPETAHNTLGDGPLRDVIVSALSLANTICYVISLAGTVLGTKTAVTKDAGNTGVGNITLTGDPRNEYDVQIVIDEKGGLNEAVFHYVLDGVPSSQITVPDTPGTYLIPGTGITLTFDPAVPAAEEESFEAGDKFTFSTTEPQASNAEILTAIDTLIASNYDYEWINIAGVSDSTLWAALDVRAAGEEVNGRYFYFKCQARNKTDIETIDEWVTALTEGERGMTASTRVQVYAGWIEEADPYGAVDQRGCIGLGTGMSARRDIHEPVDATKYGAVPGVIKLLPEGINGGHIDALDNAGYATFCTYQGQSGVYITHGRMTAPDTSDFQLEERRRVMDYALTKVKKAQFIYINSDTELGADGSLEGIDMFHAISEQPLKNMKKEGKISDGMILIDEGQDILATEKIITKVRILPLGKMTWIENVFSFYNPNLSGGN